MIKNKFCVVGIDNDIEDYLYDNQSKYIGLITNYKNKNYSIGKKIGNESHKDWLKIKTSFDNYVGYIKSKSFSNTLNCNYKVYKLKSKIYKKVNNKLKPTKKFLYFASKIKVYKFKKLFAEYERNKWIKKLDIKKINHYEKNFSKIIKLFLNTRYLWGGKSAFGIDCSALIQMYYYYNDSFFHEISILKVYLTQYLSERLQLDYRHNYWIFEGVLTYMTIKYIEYFYPDYKILGKVPEIPFIKTILKGYNLSKMKFAFLLEEYKAIKCFCF